MRVLTLYGAGDMRLEERPVPHPGPNQLVVKINYVGVCGTDVEFYAGHIMPFIKLPLIPGHENVGTIVELGEGVTGYDVGDRVICGPPGVCEELCPSCKRGKSNICDYAFPLKTAGFGFRDGGYAEYLLVTDVTHSAVVKIPGNVDFKDAVLFDVICVALHAVRISRFRIGDNAVVSGPGSVGLSALQFLKAAGANKLISLGVFDESEQIALKYGADYYINTAKCGDLPGAITDILGTGERADVVFECAGHPASYMNCLPLIRAGGQMMCVGTISEPVTITPSLYGPMELDYQYSFVYTEEDIRIYMDMLASGKVSFPGMVTGVYRMEDVAEQYMGLSMEGRRSHLKALIDPNL